MMRNIRLTLQYEGTNYHGWQSQRKEETIQSVIVERLWRITGSRPNLIGAGRTDAGVHALCQTASFRAETELPAPVIKKALNALLPPDIRVIEAEDVPASFHARYDAKGKRYFYLIANMDFIPPFARGFLWRVPYKLDTASMAEAGGMLVGRHDFRAYMGSGGEVENTVREIKLLCVEEAADIGFLSASLQGRYIKITVEGDGFLRHMVRNIAGTLIEVGRGRIHAREVLSFKRRDSAGPTAPARGLFLEKVYY